MPCPMFIFCVDQGLLVSYPFFLTSSSIISWSTVSAGSVFLRIFIYWKSILFFLFFKDIFVDYRILSRLLFLPPPCYPFKDVTPLSSDLHSFQGEVCCHCCLFASVWWYLFSQSASKSASLVFSSWIYVRMGGVFILLVCLFWYLTSWVFDKYLLWVPRFHHCSITRFHVRAKNIETDVYLSSRSSTEGQTRDDSDSE